MILVHPPLILVHPPLILVHPPLIRVHPPLILVHPPLIRVHPPLIRVHPPLILVHPPLILVHPPLIRVHPPLIRVHPPLIRVHPPQNLKASNAPCPIQLLETLRPVAMPQALRLRPTLGEAAPRAMLKTSSVQVPNAPIYMHLVEVRQISRSIAN
ncbi:hypothetical protein [Nostoc sp.]|uniref:hypothetical protein n=1 Tax=Nostoc sp. TaxID=1180 RepID=UPI002FFACCAB